MTTENKVRKSLNMKKETLPSEVAKHAQREGIAAFESGKSGLTNAFVAYASKSEHNTAELFKAYKYGFTIAKLAQNSDETFPSVKEYKRIMA